MKARVIALTVVMALVLVGPSALIQAQAPGSMVAKSGADARPSADGYRWQANIAYSAATLTLSGPDGQVSQRSFAPEEDLYLSVYREDGTPLADGLYNYELTFAPELSPATKATLDEAAGRGDREAVVAALQAAGELPERMPVAFGHLRVDDGLFVMDIPEGEAALEEKEPQLFGAGGALAGRSPAGDPGLDDVLHYDDVIITGSLCVGFDCQDGESFGFDTIILKEHNLRIYFNDTSYTASYPTNAWRITINDSTNGGASYFSIDDVDDGTSIFKVEAGAPSNSLYVEDYGRVGLGTSTPVVELHIKDSDTPTLRLEQDSSGGWTAQTFDVAGNESNFFIRDVTNGSTLPFRIQPDTPSSTLCLKSDGYVGIGTWSPAYPLEVETTGENATLVFERTDGATGQVLCQSTKVRMGSRSDHSLSLTTNNTNHLTIGTDGQVGIGTEGPSTKLTIQDDGGSSDVLRVEDTSGGFLAAIDNAGNMRLKGTLSQNQSGLPKPGEASQNQGDALSARIDALEAENQALADELAETKAGYATLEARLAALEALLNHSDARR